MVATPDHNHAVVALAAMRKGKHVFCQKPLTHSVREALEMAKVAAETKVATQMGNQGQASEESRVICEYIAAGAIGAVREIHSWSNRRPDISPRGIARPADQPPVPPELNWDLWLGPAPRGLTIRRTIHSPGAAGGISARACWATSVATTCRRPSRR